MFPLAVVLLPTERIPLHIFEPRYRELIGECIDEGREFGLVFEDETGTREVGTLAGVEEVLHRFDDGRLNVVVAGGEPLPRPRALTEGRSYRTAEVGRSRTRRSGPSRAEAERALRALPPARRPCRAREVERAGRVRRSSPTSSPRGSTSAHGGKQELLESRSERERLRRVAKLLERSVQALAIEQEITERAAGNGKVFAPRGLERRRFWPRNRLASVRVGVPRETVAGERRVALVPESVEAAGRRGFEVVVEPGAGAAAAFTDEAYGAAGATSAIRGRADAS